MKTIHGKTIFTDISEVLDAAHTAFVLVDLQNDFCKPGGHWYQQGFELPHAAEIIHNAGQLLATARAINVPVIFVQMTNPPSLESTSPAYARFLHIKCGLEPDRLGCYPDTWGFEIVEELQPKPGESIIQKNRSSGFIGTNLEMILRSNGIQTVVLAGVASHACVESTARDAFNHDYHVVIAEDAIGAHSPELHQATLQIMHVRYDVLTTNELIQTWSSVRQHATSGL
jgi:ureidoacrylate peracid hydrolase